jgi:hypothetical protein
MSFSFSFTAPDKATAKSELSQRNVDSFGQMPDGVEDAVSGLHGRHAGPARGPHVQRGDPRAHRQ